MNKILVNNLFFSYGEETVLKNINLEFNEKPTAIIGQNGAGKTTFVKLLKGLLKPNRGDILINGINTKEVTVAELSKHIGLIFQNPNDQLFKNRVIDEVMFGPLNIMKDEQKAKEHAIKALEMVDLWDKHQENPYDLSLAERKLISIASIIAMDTDIIIFDEPTIGQDYRGREKIKAIIKQLSAEGKLVLTIIHDMDFVAEAFERTIVFNRGEVLLDDSTRSIFTNAELLKNAYLDVPYVTDFGNKLGYSETLLTIDEFINYAKTKNRD